MNPFTPGRCAVAALVLVVLVGFFLYLPMVEDRIGWYNSAEFTIAAMTLDVPHAPGYPLFTRLGNLAIEYLPGPSAAFRVNLLTAMIGVCGAALFTALLISYGLSACAAALGGIMLLAGTTYWEQSLLAEIYTLEICLIVAGLFAGLLFERGHSGAAAGFFAGVVGAIGVGHRPTFILYALSLVLFIRAAHGGFKPGSRFFLFMFVGILVGLLPSFDLYLRLQNPQRVLLDPLIGRGIDGFLQVFSARVYSGGFFVFSPAEVFARLVYFFRFVVADCGVWLLAGPPVLFLLRRRERHGALPSALLAILVINLVFVLNYNAFEAHTMLLPAIMALAGLAAMAADRIISRHIRMVCCLAIASTAVVTGSINVVGGESGPEDFVRQSLATAPRGAVVMMSNDVEFRPYWYLRLNEKYRQDISIQLIDRIESAELQALQPAVAAGRLFGSLVYPADSLKSITASYSVAAAGYLHKILPAEEFFAGPAENLELPENPVITPGTDNVRFNSWSASAASATSATSAIKAGDSLSYSYRFAGTQQRFRQLAVATVLVDASGQTIERHGILVGHDVHFPASYFCRNGRLRLDDLKVERSLVIPADLPAGNYRIMMLPLDTLGSFPATWLDFMPRGVNLFNLDGFLEVFVFRYGLACRPLLRALSIQELAGDVSVHPLWESPVEIASFTLAP